MSYSTIYIDSANSNLRLVGNRIVFETWNNRKASVVTQDSIGSPTMTVLGSRVGIGVSSPSYTLEVDGDINFTGNMYQNSSLFTTSGGGGGGSWITNENVVFVASGSNVGVGTQTPQDKLHVVGNIVVGNNTSKLSYITQGYMTSNVSLGTSTSNYIVKLPTSDGEVNGINLSTLNKRTRASVGTTKKCTSSWITRASPSFASTQTWQSVCWAQELSLFVAVASGPTSVGRIMTSYDGIVWSNYSTANEAANDHRWQSVCWSPQLSLFVAVAGVNTVTGRAMSSPDGFTWTTRLSANEAVSWRSVCWSPGLVIRDKEELNKILDRSKDCNLDIKQALQKAIIIDWNDLNKYYQSFIENYKSLDDIQNIRKVMVPKYNQILCTMKTLELIKNDNKKILWGQIPRSGKSYCMGDLIHKHNGNNYLIITTAPNETIDQYLNLFNEHKQFTEFNIIYLNGKTKNYILKQKNIIICSKQYLQNKKIEWLSKIIFDIRFIDESHNGGTTDLAQKMLDYYSQNSITIYITATYSKPINDYSIPKEAWITWDLEDISLCKNGKINEIEEKHGKYNIPFQISDYQNSLTKR